jgi:prevent-host-death family protein
METIAVFEAKSRLSEILAAVELGQEFTVTKRGAPIARIIPYMRAGDVVAAQRARQNLIDRCLLARAAAPVDDFDVRAAIEEGRD